MDDTWLADMTERDRTDEPTGSGPTLSVVVPIFNEEETIPEMGKRLRAVLDSLGVSAEAIFVNDGSRDESLDHLRKLAAVDPRIRVIDFSRNFGHQQALYAGICRARGDAVVLMDGDLQDPPEVIPKMVERWRAGAQVVYAVRRKRKEGLAKRLLYAIYYHAAVVLHHDASGLGRLLPYGPPHRVCCAVCQSETSFFAASEPGLAIGRRASSMSVMPGMSRYAGEPKYTLAKLMRLALDGIIAYSYVPLRLAYGLGAVVSTLSFVLASVYFLQRLLADEFIPQGFTTLAILVLFLGGVQLLTIGLLGEYIGRIYDEVKRRPEFVERELIGFASSEDVP